MTNRNSTLAPGKPLKRSWIKRNTPLRHRGGRMFKQTDDDAKYWNWLAHRMQQLLPCDGCAIHKWLTRAHLVPRSRGGHDCDNIALLCIPCHRAQEKRTEKYQAEMGVDLYAIAAAHTAHWRKETAWTCEKR